MLEDVRYNSNNNISADDARIKSSDSVQKTPSFRAVNPNAVDTTPTADTYSPNGEPVSQEMGFGEKYMRYGVPAGAGLYVLSEVFNKANQGEYEKSLVGRLGNWGDKLSNSKYLNNDFANGLKAKLRNLKTKGQAFIDRHETLSAMQKTPTKPTCPLVTNFLETQAESDLKHGATELKNYLDKNPKTLRLAGATDAEIEALKSKFGTGLFGRIKNEPKAVEEHLINKIGNELGHSNLATTVGAREEAIAKQLERYQAALKSNTLNGEPLNEANKEWLKSRINKIKNLQTNYRQTVLKNLKLRSMGLNKQSLAELHKNPVENAAKIEKALENSSKYSKKMTESFNKVKSISAPKTKLGKLFPRMAKLGIRGLTFGGGLANCLLMLGFFMSEPVKNAIDAPKGEKLATAVHGFFDAMSWVVAMPLALKGMHAVNGLKNLGKTEAQVKEYEAAYEAFKTKAKSCGFASKAEYDAAWKNVEALKNVGTKPTGLKWVLSKLATFTSIGLGQKPAYKEATTSIGSFGSNFKNWIKPDNLKKVSGNLKRTARNMPKNWIGYPLRFALYVLAFQPIVDKVLLAPLTALFGKPYDPEKVAEEQAKEREKAELEALRKQYLYPGPSISPNPDAIEGLNNLDVNGIDDDNLVKQELIKRGLATPSQKFNTIQTNNDGYFNSANGVQIDIKNGNKPFMPGVNVNGPTQNDLAKQNEKDPNKSDYDTIPRSYVPEINKQNPIPYSDPFTNPNYERNYDKMRESIEKSEKFIAETEKWIDNKFED